MSVPDKCQMALKEWAITCEAIGNGEQILLLRKGGIHEDGKDFRVIHRGVSAVSDLRAPEG